MFFTFKFKNLLLALIIIGIAAFGTFSAISSISSRYTMADAQGKKYIKWIDFNATREAMQDALDADIASQIEGGAEYSWIEILSYLSAKYGNDFTKYNKRDVSGLVARLENGEAMESITAGMKYYGYYFEALTAILGEFVGSYKIQTDNGGEDPEWVDKYGLKVFSPIAKGYPYTDSDDFGAGRTYGYKRKHLGHDYMAAVGTPVTAVESGIVEELGWNQYGGWRIGIRSYDQKRYYYYAHLRKDYPYVKSLVKGGEVKAGDVIGYVGRTGYSPNENVNNLTQSHLHFGMQIIFDESQKEGSNQIWIDFYQLTRLLEKNRVRVEKIEGTKEYERVYDFTETLNYNPDE